MILQKELYPVKLYIPIKQSEKQSEIHALTKSVNMYIRVVGTSNRLFIRGSYTETKFSKK